MIQLHFSKCFDPIVDSFMIKMELYKDFDPIVCSISHKPKGWEDTPTLKEFFTDDGDVYHMC